LTSSWAKSIRKTSKPKKIEAKDLSNWKILEDFGRRLAKACAARKEDPQRINHQKRKLLEDQRTS